MAATRIPGIPIVPQDVDPALRRYLQAISEILEVRLGVRGTSLDRAVTLRELIDGDVLDQATAAQFNTTTIDSRNRGFNAKFKGLLHKNATNSKLGINTNDPTEVVDIDGDCIRLRQTRTPASATADGKKGQITWDSSYIYICVDDNIWKRVAISSWT